MALRPPKTAPASKTGFQYKPRKYDDIVAQANKGSSSIDTFITRDAKFFRPKDGDNRIRILPPGWDGAEHYGHDVYLHYGVGPDNASYLCPLKHYGEACPICELIPQATTDEEKYQFKPRRRVGVYLIDRSKEDEGPLFWALPWKLDRDILMASADKFTKEVFPVDDPVSGYDVSFTKSGQAARTEYGAVQVARSPSPLHRDPKVAGAWLDFIVQHSIPDSLVAKDYDYLNAMLTGGKPSADTVAHTTEVAVQNNVYAQVDVNEDVPDLAQATAPVAGDGTEVVVPTTFADLLVEDIDGLLAIAEQIGFDPDSPNINTKDDLVNALATELGLNTPKAEPKVDKMAGIRDRIKNLK